MAGATSKLSILIEAKNEASATLKQVQSDAGGLGKSLTGIAGAFGIAFSAQAIAGIAETGVEMARAAAEAERLGTAFETLAGQAGQSSDAMLKAMQEASQGTVSNSELMLAANRAMMLGVADSADEMAQLMQVASARGKAMGESTAEAFSDIVTGIGRLSPMILDNLGIVVDAEAANAAYAESVGKAASELSEQEQKQALVNAVLKDSAGLIAAGGDAANDAASSFERLDAASTNAKEAIGAVFAPAVITGAEIFTGYLDGQVKMLNTEVNALNQAWVAAKNFATGSHDMTMAMIEAAEAEGKADDVTRRLTFGLGGLAVQAQETGQSMRVMGADALAAMEQFNIAMATSQGIMSSINSAATQAGVLFGSKQGGDAGLAKQQQITDELNTQVELWHDMGYTDKEINEVLLPGMVSSIQSANSALFSSAKHTEKLSDEAKAAQQAFDDLTSTVSGVLQGALDPGVGVDPRKVLEAMGFPREDAINENARRLADIAANGLKGQDWLSAFQNEVPDIWKMLRLAQNPQEEAARLLQDFQDGLLTSPIDKAKAKEIVRRQITGDQNMAALATEIATELATEMGIPMQQALAAAQGTLGGGTGMGTEAATSFADGAAAALDEGNGGGSFVTKFTDQMRASYGLLATAGKDAGKLWGSNFLEVVGDNVPPALIKILTDLVTPGVVSALAQKSSLTGSTP